tara:strand:- start:30 stop:341 length:312 start_codon:yes stop_codon:yes gene_type:complete
MYTIESFDKSTGIMIFNRASDNKKISIDVREFNDYRGVSDTHYLEMNTGEIVNLQYNFRIFTGDIDNIYKKATQWEFDRWHTTKSDFENTHNAIVFNNIINAK